MLLNRENSGDRWRKRRDGKEKVTGELRYLTDMTAEGMLYGRVLRSIHPHARIVSIDIAAAQACAGVVAVITHLDVPGLNRFGIATPDQPALCEDRVRYIGDAIAAVAAETPELAEYALSLIHVDYEVLETITDPLRALEQTAPLLHPTGNVLHRTSVKQGDADAAFARCVHIVHDTYATPRQMHAYMETEGGLFVPEQGGRLTVYAPTQHGYKDRMQIARILGWKEEQIRVISSPIGGSFGGKDELNVQPYGSLLALKTGRPVKLHNSRKESVRAGLKRHPMRIEMETGSDEYGRLIAHRVRIVADTGAYATLGAPVLNFATEHAMGPYRIANVDIEGVSVYTNNGVSGEFRGFGGNQAIFAMEGQMDRLAEKLGMDPWQFRMLNRRQPHDPGPLQQQIWRTNGLYQVMEALEQSDIWQRRQTMLKIGTEAAQGLAHISGADSAQPPQRPWIKRGIGAALAMHGAGLGYGIEDPAGGRLSLNECGQIEVAFSYEEFGQGLIATMEIMLIDLFHCEPSDISIIIGDTDRVPHSGSSTASRSTTMAWMALQRLKTPFLEAVLRAAERLTGISAAELTTGIGGIWRKGEAREQAGARTSSRQTDGSSVDQLCSSATAVSVMDDHLHTAVDDAIHRFGYNVQNEVVNETLGQAAKEPTEHQGEWRAAARSSSPDSERVQAADADMFSAGALVITYRELATAAALDELIFDTQFQYPTTPDAVMGGHFLYTYAAVAAEVEVNTLTGNVRLLDTYHTVAAGPVINPMGFIGQIEGGSVMALGFTLTEDSVMDGGHYMTKNMDTYMIPTIQDMHRSLQVEAIEDLPENDPFGPRGIGEIGSVALAPAITAAIRQATGVWVNHLPVPRERLIQPLGTWQQEGVSPR
ncbi:molybdopterin cofactor-binding domain-containing protein [Paenibacillus campi]|uniref:molybdopterin cofactor-binding domain-containing protein n=1 Tax=Paenibacillus campi TaxID=3106031 RepID=UPI002AFE1C44|nr:molybdopterin cofactor-binding domain-containing protein [Paenibacillus sp. SGZ-1014]